MNYEKIALEVESIAREAATFIRQKAGNIRESDVEYKGLHNYVTAVDKGSEELIVNRLSVLIPEAGFLAEEGTEAQGSSNLRWIIDPLDGTTNFIHGIPLYSISIALMQGDDIVVGSVYEVNHQESFLAWKEGPALLNHQPIRVSRRNDMHESLLATGFPYYDYNQLDPYLQLFRSFLKNTRGLRRLGSAALDLAWVACGRFDGFYEYGLNPWDVAAGAFLVERAGGYNTDFKGGNDYIFGKQILSSNSIIHDALLSEIKSFF
ncbi:MAG: inositol monophosphatase family protein [Bacteroidales bacterium]